MAQAFKWLEAMGMCLVNGYSIVKERSAPRQNGEQVEGREALHLFLHSKGKISPSTQKVF